MIRKLVTWVLLALACNVVIKILLLLDLNKEVYNHTPGSCNPIPGIVHGSTDMELLKDGSVIIAAAANLSGNGTEESRGKLYWYDMNTTEFMMPIALELRITSDHLDLNTFNPVGITTWSTRGRTLVYVVNRKPHGDSIEAFTFNNVTKTLLHSKTISDPLIRGVGDVAAVGPDRLFISISHFFDFPPLRMIERYLLLNLGSILFYDGKSAAVVDRWLLSPKGLVVNSNRTYLYVACPFDESIRVYKLKPDNSITKQLDVALLTSPEFLFADNETGDLWTGCHPVTHKYLRHLEDPKASVSPSQVLRVRMGDKHQSWTITEPFASDGRSLSGATVGIFFNNRLLIGSAHDKLLACEISNPDLL